MNSTELDPIPINNAMVEIRNTIDRLTFAPRPDPLARRIHKKSRQKIGDAIFAINLPARAPTPQCKQVIDALEAYGRIPEAQPGFEDEMIKGLTVLDTAIRSLPTRPTT